MQLAQEYWSSLQNSPQLIEAMKETEMEWHVLAYHLPPDFFALSAYRYVQRFSQLATIMMTARALVRCGSLTIIVLPSLI